MFKSSVSKLIFLSFFIFSAGQAKAYNPKETESLVFGFFAVIAILVFLFILAGVNYFSGSSKSEEDPEDKNSTENLTENTTDEVEENTGPGFGATFRKSLVIFVIIIILLIIILTVNMDK